MDEQVIVGPDRSLNPFKWLWWTGAFLGAVFSTSLLVGDARGFVPLVACCLFVLLALWWRPAQVSITGDSVVIQNPLLTHRIHINEIRDVGCRWRLGNGVNNYSIFIRGRHRRVTSTAPRLTLRQDGDSTIAAIEAALRERGWIDPRAQATGAGGAK